MLHSFKFCLIYIFIHIFSLTMSAERSITMEEALFIAENSSPTMQKALLTREQSHQNLIAQKAAMKASFSLNLSPFKYSNTRNFNSLYSSWYNYEYLSSGGTFSIKQPILPTNTTLSLINYLGWQSTQSSYSGSTTSDKSFVNDLYVSLEQPLFTYNSQRMNLKVLELEVENSEIEYALAQLSLEKNVTTLFYNVYMAQLNLDIAREELKNTQLSRNTTADKVETKLTAKIELYQADLNLSSARSTVKNKEVALENAKASFKQYIGLDLNDKINVLASITSSDSTSVSMDKAIQYGLDSRMELRQRKIEIENELFTLIKTKDYNDFDGSVALSVGLTGNNQALRSVYDKPAKSPSVGVSFTIPLFDWGERKARIKSQKAALNSSKVDLDTERTGIIVEIGEICRNLENYRAQIDIEKQNQRNAELAYDISLEKYKNGDLTSMDLNLYQSQLSNRKLSMAQAQIYYKLEMLNLKIASLYDFEKNKYLLKKQ
jgi:outer membrane protein